MGHYKNATICLHGHVASSSESNYRKYCKECGNETISSCLSCNENIQGIYVMTNVIGFFGYDKPSYCHNCGSPYPWTSLVLENAVELVSLDDELPDEIKEIIKLAIPDLIVESPTTPVAVAKYNKYIPSAAEYVKNGIKNLLVDVVNESVKKSIWG